MVVTTAADMSEDGMPLWYATDGVVALGPVSFQQLQMAVGAGRLTAGCLVRHDRWLAWQPLGELEQLSGEERNEVVQRFARASDRAPMPELAPASRPDDGTPTSRRPGGIPRSSLRPTAVDPVGVLATATGLKEALLLLLSTAVAAASAQRAALYQVCSDNRSATVVGAHGMGIEALLGLENGIDDPGFRAALRGMPFAGDCESGPIGKAIAERFNLEKCAAHGVALLPLSIDGQLVAVLELAQLRRPFRAREVARAEDVMDVFAERCIVMGWLD